MRHTGVYVHVSCLRWPAVAAICGLALAGSVLPAMAAPVPGSRPTTQLTLTLHGGKTVSGAELARVTLTCDPAGGNHPRAAAACASLDTVGGDFGTLPPVSGKVCPMIFAPVTAEATGDYRGRSVRFVCTYNNRCVAGARTDDVFTI
jgi:hypothetical protein